MVIIILFAVLMVFLLAVQYDRRRTRARAAALSAIDDLQAEVTAAFRTAAAGRSAAGEQEPLRFVYQALKGGQLHRELTSWYEDVDHVVGFCTDAQAERTFRKDRVIRWVSGEQQLENLEGVNPPPERRTHAVQSPPGVRCADMEDVITACGVAEADGQLSILFTGWAAGERDIMELQADGVNFKVRRNVTRNLTLLCAGPNAGPAKVLAATDKGALIIDGDQFHSLLSSGWL